MKSRESRPLLRSLFRISSTKTLWLDTGLIWDWYQPVLPFEAANTRSGGLDPKKKRVSAVTNIAMSNVDVGSSKGWGIVTISY